MTRGLRVSRPFIVFVVVVLVAAGGVAWYLSQDSRSPHREGPAAAWTARVGVSGDQPAVVVDGVVVVRDETALRGIDYDNGVIRWAKDIPRDSRFLVMDGLIALQDAQHQSLDVIDPKSGDTKWRDDKPDRESVFRDVVYSVNCLDARSSDCTISRRAIQDGSIQWTVPGRSISDDALGTRDPYAPTTGPYIMVSTQADGKKRQAMDAQTGQILLAQIEIFGSWHDFTAGKNLVSTNNESYSNGACAVDIATVDATTGVAGTLGQVFSAQGNDSECRLALAPKASGQIAIGANTLIAAVNKQQQPQVVDLSTGQTLWTGKSRAAPIDGNEKALLVREFPDSGGLSLLDFHTGELKWIAPDPELSDKSASWTTQVTSRFVAINNNSDDGGYVAVYDIDTGRKLGHFPGWLVGAEDTWVAVRSSNQTVEFIRF